LWFERGDKWRVTHISFAEVIAHFIHPSSPSDQRSIKVIERTAVPVIKVSTKDSRSRVVQLDLSFDAKEHHGLEALNMIRHLLEVSKGGGYAWHDWHSTNTQTVNLTVQNLQQLPMVRPLVLVLKQFLLDRGLLTAYTGGLSSYCLFLMVARYCQEQAPTWNDCGSLLMVS
jgi:DNA polymerase sigma